MEDFMENEKQLDMPDNHIVDDLAELFKTFGEGTRIKILFCLSKEEMCVSEIANIISMSQSTVSHQLKILKQGKLVKARREGKQIIYSLADGHVYSIIGQGLEHVRE
ncbi:MAG: winged helix-turn-helix transcriptional regulator [Lachnobacterium sp.]|nr:winged helix-turn-helix transcriptional regulator [Lachnobacterium sp.]